jgi:hypothetical protein
MLRLEFSGAVRLLGVKGLKSHHLINAIQNCNTFRPRGFSVNEVAI